MPLPDGPLHGIIPPLVTPLHDRDTLDSAGLERLVEHTIAGGVHGLFALGTTGEAPGLSYPLRYELVDRLCRQVDQRVPVLVGISDTSFVESVKLARHAADAGADALVVAPPYYFPAGQPELIEYIQQLTEQLPLPLFLYNMPAMTKVSFELETVRRLIDLPGIAGIKDSSGQMGYFHQLVRLLADRPDLSLLIGPEEMLAESVLLGGHGGVSGGANLFPQLYVDLYHAARQGDLGTARSLHHKIIRVSSSLYTVGRHSSSIIKGIKGSLKLLDICNDAMAAPSSGFQPPEIQLLRDRLSTLQREVFGYGASPAV